MKVFVILVIDVTKKQENISSKKAYEEKHVMKELMIND